MSIFSVILVWLASMFGGVDDCQTRLSAHGSTIEMVPVSTCWPGGVDEADDEDEDEDGVGRQGDKAEPGILRIDNGF